MGERPFRWGILGAGGIAAKFAADLTLSPTSQLAAVAARDADRATAFAAAHGAARSYGSYQALVADPEVDVVYIATTHAQHHEHALLALRAGKPVLVEKAFTLNAREAREVVAQARTQQVFCMEGMWMRMHPLIRQAQQIVHSGQLGELVSLRADLSRVFPYSPTHRLYDLSVGGGALLDLGVYPINFAWLMFGRPDVIVATGSLAPTGSDATVALQWGYADGRVAQVHCSAVAGSPAGGLVCGTRGWLEAGPRVHHPERLVLHTDDGDTVIESEPPVGNGFGHEIAEVERCIAAGFGESPLFPLAESVAILESVDEARRQLGVRYAADDEE
jgi:predicted dehydrogenase